MAIMPACHATRAFVAPSGQPSAWLRWLVVLATLLAMASGGTAEARTAKIALVVSGDEQMQADLKELVERFEKEQPLTGDSLGLAAGRAGGAAADQRPRCARAATMTPRITATVDGQPIDEAGRPRRHRCTAGGRPGHLRLRRRDRPASIASADVAIRRPPRQSSLPGHRPQQARPGAGRSGRRRRHPGERRTRSSPSCASSGYALAGVKREVVVDHATREATVTFVVETGPLARMGPVRFSGTEKVDTVCLQRRVPFKEGDPYDPGQGRRPARQADLARRVQRGAHQARDDARRQRRAADRCRADRPACRARSASASATRRSSASRSAASGRIATCSARPRACG